MTKEGKRLLEKQKIYKNFFNKLGKRNITNRDYEDFLINGN